MIHKYKSCAIDLQIWLVYAHRCPIPIDLCGMRLPKHGILMHSAWFTIMTTQDDAKSSQFYYCIKINAYKCLTINT